MTDTANHSVTHHIDAELAKKLKAGTAKLPKAVVGDLFVVDEEIKNAKKKETIQFDDNRVDNKGAHIFDGTTWVPLRRELDPYGTLPSQFHVIDNGVPANYWSHHPEKGLEGISAPFVNFDYKAVKEQCIANLHFDSSDPGVKDKYLAEEPGNSFTKFYYKDDPKPYFIYFPYSNKDTKKDLLEILKKDVIELQHIDHPRKLMVNYEFLGFEEYNDMSDGERDIALGRYTNPNDEM